MARSIFSIALFLLSFSISSQAQQGGEDEVIIRQFIVRDSLFASSSQLYLHTDKSVYTSNENIWFTAYLLRANLALSEYHTLHVLLSHRITHEVVGTGDFVMMQGLAAGNIFIPDSFPAGDYNLVAYTNAVNKERNPQVFQQQISIRYAGGDPFRVELKDYKFTDSIRFLAQVTNKQMFNATGASFNYEVFGDDRLMKAGQMIVTPFGEVPVSVQSDSLVRKMDMKVTVKKEKALLASSIPLSFLDSQISFRWYPESGDWIDGLPTRTSFEVIDRSGKAVAVKGQLLKNGVPVAQLSAAAGLGLIQITPDSKGIYSISLEGSNKKLISAGIPPVKSKGVVLNIDRAVTNDTLVVKLQSKNVGNKFFLLVHDYRQGYNFSPLQLNGSTALLRVPLDSLPAGLATFTVFDSELQPLAERTFFKGYDSISAARIKTDSQVYHRRSKVQLKIKMEDGSGMPLPGSFSISTALTRRVDTTRFQDIVPYFYFREYETMGLIPRIAGYSIGSKEDLEMLLLTRCWTRYNQPLQHNTVNAVNWERDLSISGRVKNLNNKKLKKPVAVTAFGGTGLPIMTTDSSGYFAFAPEMTALLPDQHLNVIINEKNKEDFTIEFNHEKDSLNKELAGLFYPASEGAKAVMPADEETLNKVQTLTAVVVKSSVKNQDRWGDQGTFTSKTCSDYVCMNNILNCGNHRNGTPAVEGGLYHYRGNTVVYHCPGRNAYGGAAELLHKLKGRYYAKEFYIADYAEFNPPDPEKLSTIYWSPQTITDENGEATISFYTNDLTGVFTLVLEGINSKGVVSGRQLIRVVE
ncbi:hypothetical protein LZZ85_07820 [Terrimonas sp. NA20]|uniref:Carboxypeptidase regulatory-like domain-containing protein n=1 Tax=Terrimonas ginsenosidimutans TaxID=2908004 RepID=A0ABS9KPF8_9BACT|nr:hypothetical protein [Terrimonas ginsenosidimutans]MCG2614184.1 hypothetical protein [Terrimonas ginsenosidimutans]